MNSLKQSLAVECSPSNRLALKRQLSEAKRKAFELYCKNTPSGDKFLYDNARGFFNHVEKNVDIVHGEVGYWFFAMDEGREVSRFMALEVKI